MMNKLMLNKGRASACLILLCLFLAQGCRKDILQPNSNDLQNGISIAEAKAYFDANLRQGAKPEKLMSTSGAGNTVTADNYLTSKQPIWNQAYQKMLATGNAVKMPIDFGNAYAVVNEAKNELMPLSALNYLFMYKDSLQVIHAEWVMLLPDSAWLYGSRNNYSGRIIVKDWSGKTIRNLSYRPIGSVNTSSTIKNRLLSSNGKIQNTNGAEEIPSGDVVGFCTRWPTGKCPKISDCSIKCDMCLAICAKLSCNFFDCSPSCDLPSEPGTGGGGGGGGGNPSAPGGGGAYPPDDCGGGGQIPRGSTGSGVPSDANSIPVAPCIPKPVRLRMDMITNFLGITDTDKQDFLLANDNIYDALVNYVVINGYTPENLDFVDWGAGYLTEDPTKYNQAFKDLLNGVYNEYSPIFIPKNFDVQYSQEWYDGEDELGLIDAEILQQGIENTDPIPEIYYIKNMGIDMTPAYPRNGKTVFGNPRNAKYFWDELMKKRPEMFSAKNRAFIKNNQFASVIVDEQWVKYNPFHKSYMDNQLVHHHHKQRNMAFAIPAKVHTKWTAILHAYRKTGKIIRIKGSLNSLGGMMQVFSFLTDINTGNPDAWVNWFGGNNEVGKIYKQPQTGDYFMITEQTMHRNSAGNIDRAIVTYDVYADYIWDDDEKKYMGVLKLGTFTENIDMINRTSTGVNFEHM